MLITSGDKYIYKTGTLLILQLSIMYFLTTNDIFYKCVALLKYFAAMFGMTYEEINVWIFCVIWPLITLLMIFWIFHLIRKNNQLRKLVIEQKPFA